MAVLSRPADRSKAYCDRALRLLRQHRCRITTPRVTVVEALSRIDKPVTAYELHHKIQSAGTRMDVVSIYRILDTLRLCGLVYCVPSKNAYLPVFLESASDRLSEIVLHEDTEEVTELKIPSPVLEQIEHQARELGIAITSIKIELRARTA